jgi:hypothetical protein
MSLGGNPLSRKSCRKIVNRREIVESYYLRQQVTTSQIAPYYLHVTYFTNLQIRYYDFAAVRTAAKL